MAIISDATRVDDLDALNPRKKPRLAQDGHTSSVSQASAVSAQIAQEQRFGISAFVSRQDNAQFTGVVKQRYTDFLVNEVASSGHVWHLEAAPTASANETNGKTPNEKPVPESATDNGTATVAQADNGKQPEDKSDDKSEVKLEAHISAEDNASLEALFGERTTKAMIHMYTKILARPDRKTRDFGNLQSDVVDDKQKRTDAHVAVRRILSGKIDTITEDDNRILIKASAPPKKQNWRSAPQQGNGARVRGKVGWEELGGEYLHFTLYKENKDTMEILYFLGSQLKLQPKNFQTAGTKDRRAVTVQRVSAFRVPKDKLLAMNAGLRQARISSLEYQKSGLELGGLWGNEFVITLRDCSAPGLEDLEEDARLQHVRTTIANAVEGLGARGFLNYYGLQRFGTFATSTDEIGRLLLQGKLKEAIDGILTFSSASLAEAQNPTEDSKVSQDDKSRALAIDIWNRTKKAGTALEKLPRKFQAENAVIRHLGWADKRSGEQRQMQDYQGALSMIARNLRLMYVHAYQSLVWNSAVSRRWEIYADKVVEGDLILIHEHDTISNPVGGEEVDEDGEVIIRPAIDDSAAALDEKYERARPLSREEAESGRFTMFDLVLPLPGFDVIYPANEIGDFYITFMGKDDLNPHNMRRRWKDLSLSGSYRKIMARPANVSHEVKTYSSEEEQLVETDLERLGESMPAAAQKSSEVAQGDSKIALVLKMQLGSSQYATMALRELTKGGAIGYKPEFSGR